MFVAHRLRTIYDSDQIIVLKNGRVAESGTHGELLNKEGVYSQLWTGKINSLDPMRRTFTDILPLKPRKYYSKIWPMMRKKDKGKSAEGTPL